MSLGAAGERHRRRGGRTAAIPEGGHLANAQVQDATQIDEIFNALDEETRESFQRWQANAAVAIQDRGLDLNDAFGNLGPFITDASEVLEAATARRRRSRGWCATRVTVFDALSERDQELAGADHRLRRHLRRTRRPRSAALAESSRSCRPSSARHARRSTASTASSAKTGPLIQDLIPVATTSARRCAACASSRPSCENLFIDLDQLIEVSRRRACPALRDPSTGSARCSIARSLPREPQSADRLPERLPATRSPTSSPAPGRRSRTRCPPCPASRPPRHYLRQLGYLGAETLAIHQLRLSTNRGNGYLKPLELTGTARARGSSPTSTASRAGARR